MIEDLLLYLFAASSLVSGILMLVARHPMRVALALIACMLSLAGIYAMLGVHAIAVFQVLIYVGAVMVFMVYVIMLLDVRDSSFLDRFGKLLLPGIVVGVLLAVVLGMVVASGSSHFPLPTSHHPDVAPADFHVQPFSAQFLRSYWLHFELTSVLLLAAVVAAVAVIKAGRRNNG